MRDTRHRQYGQVPPFMVLQVCLGIMYDFAPNSWLNRLTCGKHSFGDQYGNAQLRSLPAQTEGIEDHYNITAP